VSCQEHFGGRGDGRGATRPESTTVPAKEYRERTLIRKGWEPPLGGRTGDPQKRGGRAGGIPPTMAANQQ